MHQEWLAGDEISRLTPLELKRRCQEYGIHAYGAKAVLVQRIRDEEDKMRDPVTFGLSTRAKEEAWRNELKRRGVYYEMDTSSSEPLKIHKSK